MNNVLDESIPLSSALASAIRVQQIASIAVENVRSERAELSAADEVMIASFEAGLIQERLVIRGPLASPSVGHLLVFLAELDDEDTLRIFYEEADERVGGPIWALLSEADRGILLHEGLALAATIRPIWERHCDVASTWDP